MYIIKTNKSLGDIDFDEIPATLLLELRGKINVTTEASCFLSEKLINLFNIERNSPANQILSSLKKQQNDFELSYETRSYLFCKSPLSRSFKRFSAQKALTEYIPMRECFIEPQAISLGFDPITEKRETF